MHTHVFNTSVQSMSYKANAQYCILVQVVLEFSICSQIIFFDNAYTLYTNSNRLELISITLVHLSLENTSRVFKKIRIVLYNICSNCVSAIFD